MNLKKNLKIILIIFFLTSKQIKSSEKAVEEEVDADTEVAEVDAETEGETEPAEGEAAEEEAAEEKPKEPEIICPTEIIKSLGMEGLPKGTTFKLDMCPNITKSCCKISDQEIIYKNWVENKEKLNLSERFKFHEKIYDAFLNTLQDVFVRATSLFEKLDIIEISDCKAISNRINHFNFPEIFGILKKSVKNMHSMFDISFSGIYCSICDANLTQFFDLKTKEIKYSEKFCRNIISNSLHPLVYFHSHLPIIVNLISNFLVNCDNDGMFLDKIIPSEFLFHKAEETSKILKECKIARNDSNWLEKCLPVCKNFEITRFSNFFQPNLEEFEKYTVFLLENIKRLEKEAEAEDVITDEGSGPARLLSEEPKKLETDANPEKEKPETPEKPLTDEEQEKKFENMDVLNLGSKSIIAEFKNDFIINGIDLFEIGKNSLINEETLKLIKELDAAAIESGETVQGGEAIDGEFSGKKSKGGDQGKGGNGVHEGEVEEGENSVGVLEVLFAVIVFVF